MFHFQQFRFSDLNRAPFTLKGDRRHTGRLPSSLGAFAWCNMRTACHREPQSHREPRRSAAPPAAILRTSPREQHHKEQQPRSCEALQPLTPSQRLRMSQALTACPLLLWMSCPLLLWMSEPQRLRMSGTRKAHHHNRAPPAAILTTSPREQHHREQQRAAAPQRAATPALYNIYIMYRTTAARRCNYFCLLKSLL